MNTSDWLKNAAKLALCLFAVPLLGWLTSMYLGNSNDGQWNSPNFPDSSFRCLGLRIAAQTRRG